MLLRKTQWMLIIGLLGLVFTSLFVFSPITRAETAEEIRAKIDNQNEEIRKLEEEIAQYTKQLTEISGQAKTLSGDVKQLDIARKKLLTDIKITQDKISAKNNTIKGLELDIRDKTTSIDASRQAIKSGIKTMNEKDRTTLIETMLSSEDFSSAWRAVDELVTFSRAVREHMEELALIKEDLQEHIVGQTKAKADLENLKSELGDRKVIVEVNAKEKNQLLSATKSQELNYKTILAQKQALKDSLQKEISDYESKLKFILDPSKLPTGTAFAWPLENVRITQLFGKTASSGRLYATGTHNGVDFGAAPGTAVMAMATGTVVGTGDTDLTCKGASFGRWVFIKYDNGLSSTYGHLSLIKATEGQRVSAGDVVGYSGNTGYSTGPHLHVSVYASDAVNVSTMPSKTCSGKIYRLPFAAQNAYLDPMVYLPK